MLMRFFTTYIFLFLLFTITAQKREGDVFVKTPEMIYSFGQSYNSWSLTAGYGPVFMYADLSGYRLIPNQKIDFGPSVWLTKHLVPAFAFELQYLQSKMHGEEGMHAFDGDLIDVSLNGIAVINQMSAKPGPIDDRWNYYLKIGVGATLFRSRLLHRGTNNIVRRDELYGSPNTDYVVLGYDESNPEREISRETELILPLGIGAMYRVNKSFDVGIESVLRFSASDKLDNILTGATNDRYLFTALNVSYKFGKKDRRHVRWTYRSEGMDMFGRTIEDPMDDEIRKLEEDIAQYEENRPIHKDSVIIVETLRIIYDAYNVRTIFFPTGVFNRFSPADQLLMGEVAVELHNNPEKKLFLYGFSDSSGPADKNMELSRERCLAVKDFLVNELSVSPGIIEVLPRGEEDLLSPVEELSPRGLQMVNRRVDMVIK